MKNKTLGITATMASAMLFGFLAMMVKFICAGGTNTLCCIVLRCYVALPFIYAYLKFKKIPMGLTGREFKDLLLTGVVGMGGTALFLYTSYDYIPTGMSTTLHFLYPMFTMLGCVIFCKEKAEKKNLIALGLCVIGIGCFFSGEMGTSVFGMVLAAISGVAYAFYTIYLGHSSLKEMDNFKIMFYVAVFTGTFALIIAFATDKADFTITPQAWVLAVFYAVLVSFIGTLGYQVGVRHIGGQNAAILSTFEPVTSVTVGAIVLHEALTFRSVLGCIAIIAAVIIIALEKKNNEES